MALGLAVALTAGVAMADFSPEFDLDLSDTKVKGNPALDIHLEFDADDEEIGNFSMKIPAGLQHRLGRAKYPTTKRSVLATSRSRPAPAAAPVPRAASR